MKKKKTAVYKQAGSLKTAMLECIQSQLDEPENRAFILVGLKAKDLIQVHNFVKSFPTDED